MGRNDKNKWDRSRGKTKLKFNTFAKLKKQRKSAFSVFATC